MDTEATIYEASMAALARKLLAQHAARCGYPGQANWAHWAWHSKWLDLPRASRPNFYEYVIGELTK